MARYLSWLANAVCFVLCCFFAARTVNAIVGASLGAAPDAASAPVPALAAAAPSWNERQVILERNLFNASLLAPANGGAALEEDLEATKLPLTLLGTVGALEPENAWAAIEDRESHQIRVVRVNDELRPNAIVLRIERRRVVIRENGSPRELVLAEDEAATATAVSVGRVPAAAARRTPPMPRRAAARRFGEPTEVAPADAANLRNPAALFAQARILPKYEGGQMVGVQVNAIKPGSIFERIGIRDGDVIKELNGIRIDSPEQSARILLEFVDARRFDVVVRNDQGEQVINFDVPD
jgi:general secretion pathway protein C